MKNFGIATVPLAPPETIAFQNCKHDISFLLMNIGKSNSLSIFRQEINTFPNPTKLKLSYIRLFCILILKQMMFNEKCTTFEN